MVLGQSANRGGVYILKVPKLRISGFMLLPPCGKTERCLRYARQWVAARRPRKGDTLTPWPIATSRVAMARHRRTRLMSGFGGRAEVAWKRCHLAP